MIFNDNERVEVWYDGKWVPGVVERTREDCVSISIDTTPRRTAIFYFDTHFHFIRHEGEKKAAPVLPKCREGERVRHVRRGTTYTVVGTGTYQSSDPGYDGSSVVIYRGEDGRLWVRVECSFMDGRFVREEE